MLHVIAHLLGIDTQSSYFYAAYSGVIPSLLVFAAAVGWWTHRSCHVDGCLRRGKFPFEDYKLCKKHHPSVPEKVTHEHILSLHRLRNLR